MEVMASILEIYLPDYAYRKSEALTTRRGNIASAAVGIYPAADGHIGIHAMPKNWPQLLDAMDAHWMADDERFADNRARLKNDDELSARAVRLERRASRARRHTNAPARRERRSRPSTPSPTCSSRRTSASAASSATIDHPPPADAATRGRRRACPRVDGAARAPLLGEHNADVLCEVLGSRARPRAPAAAGVI